MNKKQKLTRNCLEPWRSVHFDAGGYINPCCSGTLKGNFGNINTDFLGSDNTEEISDIFRNQDYKNLRRGLLTGDMLDACRTCRAVHDKDITTEELRSRVVNHLENQGINTEGKDLAEEFAFTECAGNITNKCNFSCIYCLHSGENGHSGYNILEMDRKRFLEIIDFLFQRGLKIFNFCGIGELTTYNDWQNLSEYLLDRYPKLQIRVISNFGKRLNDSELETLAKFDLIHISCDTMDAETYASLRKGGRLNVLLDNIKQLKEKFTGDLSRDPKLAFMLTATDSITYKLEGLFRFAAANNIFIHISTLIVMEGSITSRTECVKNVINMPRKEMPYIREIFYDLPRRMKAENPLTSVWEYKFIYNTLMKKADSITLNRFVPDTDEKIYDLFYKTHKKNSDAYLRKFWLLFDKVYKGIFIKTGKSIKIKLPSKLGKISYRAIWCFNRIDGNINLFPESIIEVIVGKDLSITVEDNSPKCDNILFEVISYTAMDEVEKIQTTLSLRIPDHIGTLTMVREAFLSNEEDNVAQRLADSQEPIIIWCAGLRTLQMLSNTALGKANIEMIIDSNPEKKGQLFCGKIIQSPEDIGDFAGKIIVIHSSSPEQVEFQIRQLGIKNENILLQ